MAEEDFEHTLLVLRQCFVYKIPPRTSLAGYRAKDWDLEKPLWTGRALITARAEQCFVKLETHDGQEFALCKVDPNTGSIEPVIDSSRYFVLRIEDGKGHHAFIGLGFNERSDAFDFNATILDHQKHVRQSKETPEVVDHPKIDLSLREGQTIRVSIQTKKPTGATQTSLVGGNTEFTGLLPPPPSSNRTRPSVGGSSSSQTPTFDDDNLWGDFTSSSNSPAASTNQHAPTAPAPAPAPAPVLPSSPAAALKPAPILPNSPAALKPAPNYNVSLNAAPVPTTSSALPIFTPQFQQPQKKDPFANLDEWSLLK